MPSPFPGMDPYLEGHLWPDVHNSLAYLIKAQLAPRLAAPYIVHMNNYTVQDTSPSDDLGIMYPDVEVFHKSNVVREPAVATYGKPLTPETVILPDIKPVEVRIPVVEIKDRKNNKLITAIVRSFPLLINADRDLSLTVKNGCACIMLVFICLR